MAQQSATANTSVQRLLSPDELKERLLRPWPQITLRGLIVLIGLVIILSWSVEGTNSNLQTLIDGADNLWDFITRLFPPEFEFEREGTYETSILFINVELYIPGPVETTILGTTTTIGWPRVFFWIIETIQMAIIGTLGAVMLAIPFSLLAARNVAPNRYVYLTTRVFLNTLRSIPELIYGLVFVAAVGLGPFPGVLALIFGSVGSLSRLFAEAIEQIDPQQVAAVRATGATGIQTFIYAVIPQATPLIISYAIVYFEHNVRNATILGLVGAGGIGLWLTYYMNLFQYDRVMGVVIVLVVTVTVIDRFSNWVRGRFI